MWILHRNKSFSVKYTSYTKTCALVDGAHQLPTETGYNAHIRLSKRKQASQSSLEGMF